MTELTANATQGLVHGNLPPMQDPFHALSPPSWTDCGEHGPLKVTEDCGIRKDPETLLY